jgi:hypothetical protein
MKPLESTGSRDGEPEFAETTEVDLRPESPSASEGNDTVTDVTDPAEDDSFFRWLPTMGLGYRRRRELVHRPSSDGGDFVAYATEARPVAPSDPRRAEQSVELAAGAGTDARDATRVSARDAPTVILPRRRRSPRELLVGTCVVALAVAALDIGLWLRRPAAHEPSPSGGAASALTTGRAGAGAAFVESGQAALLASEPRAGAHDAAPHGAAVETASEGPSPAPSPKKWHAKPRATRMWSGDKAASAEPAAASRVAPPLPAKDRYFEEP